MKYVYMKFIDNSYTFLNSHFVKGAVMRIDKIQVENSPSYTYLRCWYKRKLYFFTKTFLEPCKPIINENGRIEWI